jgi:hypothetical protein
MTRRLLDGKRAGALGGAGLVLAWASVAPFLCVVLTPGEKPEDRPTLTVVFATSLDRPVAPRKDAPQPSQKVPDGKAAPAPAPQIRQAVSTDLDPLAAWTPPPPTPSSLGGENGGAAAPAPEIPDGPAALVFCAVRVTRPDLTAGPPTKAPRPPPVW